MFMSCGRWSRHGGSTRSAPRDWQERTEFRGSRCSLPFHSCTAHKSPPHASSRFVTTPTPAIACPSSPTGLKLLLVPRHAPIGRARHCLHLRQQTTTPHSSPAPEEASVHSCTRRPLVAHPACRPTAHCCALNHCDSSLTTLYHGAVQPSQTRPERRSPPATALPLLP